MDQAQQSFYKREQALRRKHIRMSRGYVTRMNRNGIIEQVPDRHFSGIGFRLVLRLALVVMAFKVLAFAWLGETQYLSSVTTLSQGALHEKAGAWVMQADPVTRAVAGFITPRMG
ncbi:hypothetical protein [Antarctobacter heliothermus]|uniref:Uncharacterized protein n=1 Tax=Antarctobacter heliothermus TaxID=74033 RepID=A0A239C099_9RHOB|nr:hypothetical protein [Antarctobacter heliothermus]SNS13667.1 hypothetical protein SAMN04488078_100550 [Antarctobacter heliothermus]